MSASLSVFKQYLYSNLRDSLSLFWYILFPVVLLTILILIFSGMGEDSGMTFTVSLVNRDTSSSPVDLSQQFSQILVEGAEQEEPWIRLYQPRGDQDLDLYLDSELDALAQGQRHVVLVIPQGFNQKIFAGVGQKMMGYPGPVAAAEIQIYQQAHQQASEMVASLFQGIIQEMNVEMALEVGFLERDALISSSINMVEGAQGLSFSYRDYIVPGVVLMSFLMTGLFFCLESLLSFLERGILRRYFVTPLSTLQYFSGLILWILLLSSIQILLVYGVGSLFFQVNPGLLSLSAMVYYLYALVVFISFGFLLASLSKTAESGSALANIILYPIMFLGGLFFPVDHVPVFIRVIVLLNPATYLVNGIRDTLGVYPSFTSPFLNLLVPGLWLLFSLFFSLKAFRWEVS